MIFHILKIKNTIERMTMEAITHREENTKERKKKKKDYMGSKTLKEMKKDVL